MNDESRTARQIFCELIELGTPDEQDQYLADQTTDSPVIGQRVRSLLQAHRSSEKFLGGSRVTAVDADSTPDEETQFPEGFQIDRYRLVEVIGEGGFGVVYRAEQREPVCRQVALKLIKPGMDTRQVVARFEYERQALAMMDHPNIARVLDGGATKNGRPYFVMELVCGQPISKFCDSQSMELVDRLTLFQTVCDGVQHAHQKGIIHRDLKPSNILVVSTPTGPIVKIIDFGVAKAIHHVPGDQSSLTHGGTLIGTPVYMSPEQTTPGIQDIDTRSDIYSLGVILYELLAGSTPFDKKWLESLGADQFRHTISEVDPPRPSQRTMQLANAFKNDDPQRYRETKKKGAMLRGELDWIVLMALEKERERRYPSAGALASDISRYLVHEPVRASPPSATYRFRKFARRNRFVLSTATLLVLGLSAMVVYGFQAARLARDAESRAQQRLLAEQLAHDEAKKARDETHLQRLEADQQRGRAEANLVDARAALDQILLPILDQPESAGPIAIEVRNTMLREALRFYELFLERNAADPQLRAETARASGRVASVHFSLGELEPAEQAARRTVQLFGSLTDQFGAQSSFANELADSLSALARILRERNVHLAEAESLLLEAIELHDQRLVKKRDDEAILVSLSNDLHDLGYLRAFYGKQGSAEAPLMRCIDVEQQLAQKSPEDLRRVVLLAHRINSLGIFLRQTRRSKEAEAMHRRALKLIEEWTNRVPGRVQPSAISGEYVRSVSHLAMSLEMQMKFDESEQLIRQVIGIRQASLGDNFGDEANRIELALTITQLAGILEKQSRFVLANDEYQRANELLDRLSKAYPQIFSYQFHYLNTLRRWGNLAMRQEFSDLARQRFELLAMCPTDTAQAKSTMAWHFCTCGLIDLRDAGRALELARAASAETPEDGRAWAVLGMALYRNDLISEAKPILEKAKKMLDSAGDNSAAYFQTMAHWKRGETQVALELWRDIDPKWDSQRADMLELQACRKEAATLLGVEFEIP